MKVNKKKAIVCCDYCQHEKDVKGMYTARMQFAGIKIADILKIVAHRSVPLSTPINLCAVCISTLHASTGTIERAALMLTNILGPSKEEEAENGNTPSAESDVEEIVQTPAPLTNGTPITAKKPPTKAKPLLASTPNPAAVTPNAKQPPKTLASNETTTDSPRKQPKQLQDDLDDSLQDVIKLTPAKEVPKKDKAMIQLFGNSVNHISDSEDGSEDDSEVAATAEKTSGFECKLCDFKSNFPAQFKRHLRENHGQKRPRIFNCTKCPKSFGVVKSLGAHMLTHLTDGEDADEDEDEEPQQQQQQSKSVAPQLAVLTALKPAAVKPATPNDDYTFAIKNSNSSTPKPNELVKEQTYSCELCQQQFNVVKDIQEHMKSIHHIEKPRIFKCVECVSTFMHKTGLDRHVATKHNGEQHKVAGKLPMRRGTIDLQPSSIQNEVKPAKITARRKTVSAQVVEQQAAQLELPKPIEIPDQEAAVQPSPRKASASPKKKLLKDSKQEDAAISSLLDEVFKTVEKKSKPAGNNTPKQSAEEEAEESVLVTPNRKPKAKKALDTPDSLQLTPMSNGSAKKSLKRKSDKVNKSPAQPEEQEPSPLKKSKLEQQKKSEASPVVTEEQRSPLKKAKKTNQLAASPVVTKELEEQKELQPSPAKKSKLDKRNKLDTSPQPIEEQEEPMEVLPSPVKKIKLDNRKKSECEVIELLDEINTNPMPHKREMLESQEMSDSQLSCSQCSKIVSSRKRLDSHIKKKHTPILNCRKCDSNFFASLEFINHFSNCDKSGGLQCGVKNCDKLFEAPNFLSSHLKKKHKFN